jgi:hypothetical protein
MTQPQNSSKANQQTKLFYKISSWSFILVGIGHLIGHLLSPKTSEQIEMLQTMKEFTIAMPGTETNLLLFYTGFSLMMGIMLLSYGVINLLLLKNIKQINWIDNQILITNTLVSFMSLILAIKYFFIIPIVLMGIALTGFTLALIITNKQ